MGCVLPLSFLVLACSSENSAVTNPVGDGGIAPEAGVSSPSGTDTNTTTEDGESSDDSASDTDSRTSANEGSDGDTADETTPVGTGSSGTGSDATGSDTGTGSPNQSSLSTGDDPAGTSGTTASIDSTLPVIPAGEIDFVPAGGTFETSQVVLLEGPEDATMHYTLDGTLPTADSPLYEGPITLDDTAIIRVLMNDGGTLVYGSQTYVHLEQDAVDFESDLPVIVIERHRDTPIDKWSNDLRPSSLLVFEPGEDGRTHLLGPATLSHRAGARVRGAYSRDFDQLSYAVEAWKGAEDDDDDISLLGMPPDADWVLSAPSQMDRALMRNRFAMDLSRTLGSYAPRVKFVEVFLVDNQERAALSMADYIGVYSAMEKIKRGPDRVDITKLRDSDVSGVALTGGYMFRIDHDAYDFSAGGYDFGWVYPDTEDMLLEARQPQVDYITGYLDEFFACLTEQDFTNPDTQKHYSEYIDLPAWIDHHLVNMLTKNVDGLRLSSYFHKDRNNVLVAGPVWDFDRSLGTPHDDRCVDPDEWASSDGTDHMTWGFWGELFQDPDFEAAYWSRWDELREGPFSKEALTAMVDAYEAELTEARERHFERWTDDQPVGSPANEVQIVRDWIDERLTWVDGQRP